MNLVAFFWLLLFVPPALWYLGSRALITRAIWSRYPARLVRFMDCAACTSFWWGMLLFLLLAACDLTLGYPSYTAPLWGLTTLVTGALVGYLHDQALYRLGEPHDDDVPSDAEKIEIAPLTFAEMRSDVDGLIKRNVP